MLIFYQSEGSVIYAAKFKHALSQADDEKLVWLFGNAKHLSENKIKGTFVGPRKEMITPWSTNAVEITQNMGIEGVERIEQFVPVPEGEEPVFDKMLQRIYKDVDENVFTIDKKPDPVVYIDDMRTYNQKEGLALSEQEIEYLENLGKQLGRKLTDSEVFGFSQVNSEHCRHKIFGGQFIIDGKPKEESLFQLIKNTSKANPRGIVSAYKDNVAFLEGHVSEQFAPEKPDTSSEFEIKDVETVLSMKAETHNFPTTVEPFNGAATGSGGEIRDRMAGGKGSFPIAGTAVYMTSYPRLEEQLDGNQKPLADVKGREWERQVPERKWLYQTPVEILIKASNGASDFGNKFGQPLINGSLMTFEYFEDESKYGFDKVIMQAGGIGYAKKQDSLKGKPTPDLPIVVLGGDNYRIGMGGGAVSSVATGQYKNDIELNAVQRSNPEMQKRVYNAIRAISELDTNPIVSVHDHGAGGHLNCLSELVEETGGTIEINKLPVGDPTLSSKEIIGNESQERMGLVIDPNYVELLNRIADRERAPMYVVGKTTNDMIFKFVNPDKTTPINLKLEDFFGNPPKTVMNDITVDKKYAPVKYSDDKFSEYLAEVLQIEAVACKDWLTNKVDRSVTGKIARQQTTGAIQLPLCDLGAVTIDYTGTRGMATALGHAPAIALIDAQAGSRMAIAESLTNIVWAPLENGIDSISLSANWMWPCKNTGEDARLYSAVEAASKFAIELGINIPTGKDSLSMTQKYPDGSKVLAPGTVIITSAGDVSDVKKIVTPDLKPVEDSQLLYIDFSKKAPSLGGSSFAQVVNSLGDNCPDVADSKYFRKAFNTVQKLVNEKLILAGHDVSAGGLITTLLEMTFSTVSGGLDIELTDNYDLCTTLFSENPGVVIQIADLDKVSAILNAEGISFEVIGKTIPTRNIKIAHQGKTLNLDIISLRDIWFKTSYLLDSIQTEKTCAESRFNNYNKQSLEFAFPKNFTGKFNQYGISPKRRNKTGIKAAIIREKGINGDREMAYTMYLAGFDVKDVHMTDLASGRETLEDVNFIVYCGGFSNSDVLGSAKGWAGAFKYNEKASKALENFYKRPDTLSLGVCNGCQLMNELDLVYPGRKNHPKLKHNDSHKFESAFLTVDILDNNSVMLKSLAGTKLGVWVAHGEGKFQLPDAEETYNIPMKYSYDQYPGNPNGSDYNAAAIVSEDGRHLSMMPHPERAIFNWQWGYYPYDRKEDEVSPWIEAFVNARKWIEEKVK
ncbi:MAG: phosphoribosylformylglycinamidine synthase [Bacteroidales bacterium]|nr:phosphoribosylformylglycinamidine synthase [Bacteroidales bacterium]